MWFSLTRLLFALSKSVSLHTISCLLISVCAGFTSCVGLLNSRRKKLLKQRQRGELCMPVRKLGSCTCMQGRFEVWLCHCIMFIHGVLHLFFLLCSDEETELQRTAKKLLSEMNEAPVASLKDTEVCWNSCFTCPVFGMLLYHVTC